MPHNCPGPLMAPGRGGEACSIQGREGYPCLCPEGEGRKGYLCPDLSENKVKTLPVSSQKLNQVHRFPARNPRKQLQWVIYVNKTRLINCFILLYW